MHVHHGLFGIGNEMHSIYTSFRRAFKKRHYEAKSLECIFMMLNFSKYIEIDINHRGAIQNAYYRIRRVWHFSFIYRDTQTN